MRVLLVSEGPHEGSGALEQLVRRMVPVEMSCEWRQVKDSKLRVHAGKGRRLFKRAIGWIQQARREGFDALVLVVDEDGDPGRADDLERAQDEYQVAGSTPRALGLAIRCFDAWMLADEEALTQVLALAVPRQRSPESLRDPKASCANFLQQSHAALSQRELYACVARQLDLGRLIERCPDGFGVFAARLRTLQTTAQSR